MPVSASLLLAAVLPAMPLIPACVTLLALPLALPIPAPPVGLPSAPTPTLTPTALAL